MDETTIVQWTIYPGKIDEYRNSFLPTIEVKTQGKEESFALHDWLLSLKAMGLLTYSIK